MSGNGKDGKDGKDNKPKYEFVAGRAPGLPPLETTNSLGAVEPPMQSDMQAGVDDILSKLNQTTIHAKTDWTKVAEAGCMRLWTATRAAGDVTLTPVVPGLKKFLKDLFAQEHTGGYLSMKCDGVEVCFMWRCSDQAGLEDWTPPCDE